MLQTYIILYFILINLITFVIRGIDKRKAVRQKRRISEKELLILTALGGFIGAISGISVRRHKTIKSKFLWKFWLIVFVWIIVGGIVFYAFNV